MSIIGLMTRQIHAMDTAMPAFPPGETKLCVNADLVPGLPPPNVIRNAEASLSAGDVSSMIPISAFFIRMVEVSLWLTGNGTRGIDLTDCRSRFANSAFSPGKGEAHDADLGQPQLLGKVDLREIKPGSAGVDVNARDDA